MSFITKFILFLTVASAIHLGMKINSFLHIPPLPDLEDTWWGPGKQKVGEGTPRPFKIDVPDKVLTDLKFRLNNARQFTPPLEGIQQQYGMNTDLLNDILDYWKNDYNWREREKFLNQYPQFKVDIQGLEIHYIHVKPSTSAGRQVIPLLLLHGWPGSVREFYELIPYLTNPALNRRFVFELIIPSLPGYGFSQAASKPGLGAIQMSRIFKNLMERVGLHKFYVQGGDWGAIIASNMAVLYPDQVLGMHSNLCVSQTRLSFLKLFVGSLFPSLIVEKKFEHRMYPLSEIFSNILLEMGYMHLQATKPDTVGVGLNDSPVGLAAYILEKFTTWTNPAWKERQDGGLKLKYKYADLLDNVMIYWVTGSITSSIRLYSETLNKAQISMGVEGHPVEVPTACARFAYELGYQSDTILQDKFKNLLQITDVPVGGHFSAFEEPKVFADDLYTAVEKFLSFNKEAEAKKRQK